MANSGSLGQTEYTATFVGNEISSTGAGTVGGYAWVTTATTTTNCFAQAVAAGRGYHATGNTPATDDHNLQLCGNSLGIYGQHGYSMVEVLFQLDVATDIAINVGFNDEVLETTGGIPIELATTTWTTNAATALMLVYDVDATNDDWHCMWVDDNNDASETLANLRMSGSTLAASKWVMARVEMQDRGSGYGVRATFTIAQDGKTWSKEFDTSVDRDCALTPYFGIESRAGTAHNAYVKYVKVSQSIAD